MRNRPAVTLVETLIAIFIMGIGLLALLTLFPFGALQMAQAIKDDRTAHANTNAHSLANALDLRVNPAVLEGMRRPSSALTAPPYSVTSAAIRGNLPDRTSGAPSYPVFVDPLGYRSLVAQNQPAWQYWLGGQPGGVPRRSLRGTANTPDLENPAVATLPTLLPYTTFQDDMKLLKEGQNAGLSCPPGGLVERGGDYTWAWLCKMRNGGSSSPSVVDLTVVVYKRRSVEADAAPELVYSQPNVTFRPNEQMVQIRYMPNQRKPPIRKGGWILDASPATGNTFPEPQGTFYRVVNVLDQGQNAAGELVMEVELQTKPRADDDATPAQRPGRIIVLENVVEVFPKRTF